MCALFQSKIRELQCILRQYYDTKQKCDMNETQSIFYMPIITISYWIVRCQRQRKTPRTVYSKILEHMNKIFYIFDCDNYEDTFYIISIIINRVCEHINHNYEMIEEYYKQDKGIPMNNISHIEPNRQEEILNCSKISKDEMDIICDRNKDLSHDMIAYDDNNMVETKYIIDACIQMRNV